MSTKLKTIPKGYKVIDTAGGTFLQQSKQRRRRYKTPKAVRNKIAAAQRRFYVPLITGSAIALGTWQPIQLLTQGNGMEAGRIFLRNYTGVYISEGGQAHFRFRYLMNGTIPLLIAGGLRKSGVFKKTNTMLAKQRIPVRFN